MASSIVTSAAQQLGTLLAEEAKYLYVVSDKIKNLKSELEWMQCFLHDVDTREHQEKVARKWVAEIREFAYEAEDLIERYVCKVSHHRRNGFWNTIKWFSCVCGDALTLHDIGLSMDDLSNRISKMISRLQMYGVHISTKQPECPTCNFSMKKPKSSIHNLFGRDERKAFNDDEYPIGFGTIIEKLVDKLVEEEGVNVLEIFGSPGSGKTTLARKVYLHRRVQQHFKKCVWVYVFQNQDSFSIRKVYEEILKGLLSNEEDHDARERIKGQKCEQLQETIRGALENEDCLVILDDVDSTDWFTPLQTNESIKRGGSKILITTENKDGLIFSSNLSYGYSHPMSALLGDDSWLLLRRTALLQPSSEKERLGKKMLTYCTGYPMTIAALGGILATKKTDQEWKAVSNNISSQLTPGDENNELVTMLELSYSDLPFYLKSCFMYLGLFPKGSEIPVDRLYHLWEVEGFITTSEDEWTNVHDDIAESYLNQLVRRCMVQADKRWPDGRIKSCRLRPTMRELCVTKCREVNFVDIIERGSSKCNINSRRRVIHWTDEVGPFGSVGLNEGPYLRSLSVFTNESPMVEKMLSQKMRDFLSLLRVLDLEGAEVGPQCNVGVIKYCIHLRYLSLRRISSDNDRVPHIWNCIFLESLDLRIHYKSPGYPIELRNKLWKLGRLRHLYLPDHFVLLKDKLAGRRKLHLTPAQVGQMETLVNFDVNQCHMEHLSQMTNLRTFSFNTPVVNSKDALVQLVNSPALKSGNLRCNPFQLKITADAIDANPAILTSLSSLRGCVIDVVGIFGKIDRVSFLYRDDVRKIFPIGLKRLHLDDCAIHEEGILQLEVLPDLKELTLSNLAISGSKMSFSHGSFLQLAKLTLKHMHDLEEWEVGEEALPKLIYLEVKDCIKLKMIPQNLPSALKIRCSPSDINGSEKYMHYTDSTSTI